MKYIAHLLFFLAVTTAKAQVVDYDIQYFFKEQGLSNSTINDIYQDNDGYIWIATGKGLNRFDGQEFRIYSKRENGLLTNYISKIFGDQNNQLWLINYSESNATVSIFNKKTEKTISFEEYFPNAPFEQKDISFIDSDKNGICIVTKQHEVYLYLSLIHI